MSIADFPIALQPLFEPHRYKIAYGGRGGSKSWSIASYLALEAAKKPTRVLCCREFQASIRESVHRLLSDRIRSLGLAEKFDILDTAIRSKTGSGSEFIFEGLRHNAGKIRSLEAIDKVWVEEAANVSKTSWEILIPTIRKDGSEIIISFNPELETDETYQRFIARPPRDAVLMKVNYPDNPWFPEVLKHEMEDLKARDPDAYAHVYLGECRLTLDGAIYAKELRDCTEEGRITSVPYDPNKPVSVYFDLGWQDLTTAWFAQHIAGEVRLIDYLEGSQRAFPSYLRELQAREYVYATIWLPHDAEAKQLGTGRSIEEITRAAGWRVRIVPRLSVADGISAARTLFPTIWFDRERCADGLQALRHYRYDLDPNGQFSRAPLHDHASHGADALRYVAVAMQESRRATWRDDAEAPPRLIQRGSRGANLTWMTR